MKMYKISNGTINKEKFVRLLINLHLLFNDISYFNIINQNRRGRTCRSRKRKFTLLDLART